MTFRFVRPDPFSRDHIPTQSGKASDRRPESKSIRMDGVVNGSDIEFEQGFFLSLGWPPDAIRELEAQARNANTGLIQTAIASGALKASTVYDRLSRMLSFA